MKIGPESAFIAAVCLEQVSVYVCVTVSLSLSLSLCVCVFLQQLQSEMNE